MAWKPAWLKDYLAKFAPGFNASTRRGDPTDLESPTLAAPDLLARFCYSQSHYSKAENCLLPAAFMPPKDLQLSTFIVDRMKDDEIHAHGVKWATRQGPPPKPPKGFGKVPMVAVENLRKFQFERDDPPPLHAILTGWPTEKSEQKVLAEMLAEICGPPCFPT